MRTAIRRIAWGLVALAVTGAIACAAMAWNAGYRIYVVHTGSMMPTLNPGDAVLDRPAPMAVHSGQVVTFTVHSGPDTVVTHRVASVSNGEIQTKGDANRTVDPWTLRISQVVGSKVLTLPYAGYLLVYLQHPQGIASVLTAVVALILLWQLFFPPAPGASGESADCHQQIPRDARHRRESQRIATETLSTALRFPSPRRPDIHRPPAFLRSGLGPIGRPADRRGYFD